LNRWVVAGAAVVVQAGLGSYYSWSVFREPLSDLYGANITRVNVAFLLASFVFTIAAFGGGLLMRRVGPRAVGVAGGFLYGLGVFLSSFAGESLPVLYLTYGVVVGTGLGFGYIAPLAALPTAWPSAASARARRSTYPWRRPCSPLPATRSAPSASSAWPTPP
jgi:OFA family oxalate/formate antiporter-like MFS transporter